jgi:uncharacterized protein
MKVWAIADLHLCFSVPEKSMEIFGPDWKNYPERIKSNWLEKIDEKDLVLLPGDISWSKNPEEAKKDLMWLDSLPGTKIMIKGNHDYWWTTLSKLKQILPPSIYFIQNNALTFNEVSIAGARLWDTDEYEFSDYVRYVENPSASKIEKIQDDEKIFKREIIRLELSLEKMDQKAKIKIAMCHYPPISATLEDSVASHLLEKYGINYCVFGHLHHLDKSKKIFGEKRGIKYLLTSSDYLEFKPLQVC